MLKDLLFGHAIRAASDNRNLLRDQIDTGDGIRGLFLGSFFDRCDCFRGIDFGVGQALAQLFDEFSKLPAGLVADAGQAIDLPEREPEQVANLHEIQAVERIQQTRAESEQHELCADGYILWNLWREFFLVAGLWLDRSRRRADAMHST